MSRSKAIAAVLALAVAVVGISLWNGPVMAQATLQVSRTVYAAKFICGEFKPGAPNQIEGPVKPGNYQTAINVHNPHRVPITFAKKAVLLFNAERPPQPGEFEKPQPPGERLALRLEPDWGVEIDCPDIRFKLLAGQAPPPPVFIKGWVVFETFNRGEVLDVVGVYTSHGFTTDSSGVTQPEGFSTVLERVPGRPVGF